MTQAAALDDDHRAFPSESEDDYTYLPREDELPPVPVRKHELSRRLRRLVDMAKTNRKALIHERPLSRNAIVTANAPSAAPEALNMKPTYYHTRPLSAPPHATRQVRWTSLYRTFVQCVEKCQSRDQILALTAFRDSNNDLPPHRKVGKTATWCEYPGQYVDCGCVQVGSTHKFKLACLNRSPRNVALRTALKVAPETFDHTVDLFNLADISSSMVSVRYSGNDAAPGMAKDLYITIDPQQVHLGEHLILIAITAEAKGTQITKSTQNTNSANSSSGTGTNATRASIHDLMNSNSNTNSSYSNPTHHNNNNLHNSPYDSSYNTSHGFQSTTGSNAGTSHQNSFHSTIGGGKSTIIPLQNTITTRISEQGTNRRASSVFELQFCPLYISVQAQAPPKKDSDSDDE